MLLEELQGVNTSVMDIKTTTYTLTELLWHRTGNLSIDAHLLMKSILEGPFYNVVMDSFIGGYGLPSTLIKLAVKQSIKQIAKLPLDQAINVVMQKLITVVQAEQENP